MLQREPEYNLNASTLKDGTIWHWWFLVLTHSRENAENVRTRWDDFNKALKGALDWSGSDVRVEAIPQAFPSGRRSSHLIAAVPWCTEKGIGRTVEAREMLDTLYIQTGCEKQGTVHIGQIVSSIKNSDFQLNTAPRSWLGSGLCFTADVSDSIDEKQARILGTHIATLWAGESTETLDMMQVRCGFLLIPAKIDGFWILLVRDDDEARRRAEHLVHRVLPQLLFALLKARTIIHQLEQELPRIHQLENTIGTQLGRLGHQPRRLRVLEETSDAFAQQQVKFAEYLNEVEEFLETLRINVSNIERLFSDALFEEESPSLDELLLSPLRLNIEQFATDLRYLSMTQTQVDRALESIETMAAVRAVRWERRIVIFFGMFAFFGIFQAFPELHDKIGWKGRLALVALVAFLVLTIPMAVRTLARKK